MKEYLSITCVGRAGEGSRALVQSMRSEAGKVDGSPDSEDLLLKEVGYLLKSFEQETSVISFSL